jgi:hypothetical protein
MPDQKLAAIVAPRSRIAEQNPERNFISQIVPRIRF